MINFMTYPILLIKHRSPSCCFVFIFIRSPNLDFEPKELVHLSAGVSICGVENQRFMGRGGENILLLIFKSKIVKVEGRLSL